MVKCSVTGVGWLNQMLLALDYCTKDSGKERGGGQASFIPTWCGWLTPSLPGDFFRLS